MTNFKPLRLSNPAKNDLMHIAEYTFQKWGSEQKKMYLDLIKKSFNTLSSVGNIGKNATKYKLPFTLTVLKKHTIYFRETELEFVVLRILHSHTAPERHLL